MSNYGRSCVVMTFEGDDEVVTSCHELSYALSVMSGHAFS